jgi:predicted enzyme related to lactoylglutathione lyase
VVSAGPIIVGEPRGGKMLLGLRTVVYEVDDLEKAKEWYSQVLGFGPYFDEPFYVGFDVGGFELGLHPVEEEAALGAGGTLAYWGVADIEAVMNRLEELGAPVHSEVQDVGEDILVASVIDPFGNLLGIIENPHFGK